MFQYMPIAAVVTTPKEKILCVHGCIDRNNTSIEKIKALQRPLEPAAVQETETEILVVDLLWSDPSDELKEGFGVSPRGAGMTVSYDAIQKYCAANGVARIIRAHAHQENGFSTHGDHATTVWSAGPNYINQMGAHTSAAMLVIDSEGSQEFKVIHSVGEGQPWTSIGTKVEKKD